MARSLEGKCALITGSVRGLGLAAARCLAEAGCSIVLNGIDDSRDVEPVREAIEQAQGVRVLYGKADLRQPSDIEAMMRAASDTMGGLDILINNAVVRHTAPIEAFGTAEWDEGLAVNVSAAFHTIRLAVPGMKQRRWGRIINVSSIYGLRGAPNRVNYVTSKTALIGMTRAIALETVGHGITCNAVCPGTTESPVHEQTIRDAMARDTLSRDEAERRFLTGKQPTGTFIAAENVAAMMLFLCGPEAGDITGAVLPVDGGWSSS
jgi:3-hydroxybutyrate dehydrogenase